MHYTHTTCTACSAASLSHPLFSTPWRASNQLWDWTLMWRLSCNSCHVTTSKGNVSIVYENASSKHGHGVSITPLELVNAFEQPLHTRSWRSLKCSISLKSSWQALGVMINTSPAIKQIYKWSCNTNTTWNTPLNEWPCLLTGVICKLPELTFETNNRHQFEFCLFGLHVSMDCFQAV